MLVVGKGGYDLRVELNNYFRTPAIQNKVARPVD
jgi:hypothetical protein